MHSIRNLPISSSEECTPPILLERLPEQVAECEITTCSSGVSGLVSVKVTTQHNDLAEEGDDCHRSK